MAGQVPAPVVNLALTSTLGGSNLFSDFNRADV
jgi:hypothetical protein